MILLLSNISKVRLAWMRLYLEPHKIGDDDGSGWGVHICLGVEACFVGSEMDVNFRDTCIN